MRLWSLHPKYLDAKGLVALWREGLLAKKVLSGKTKGYKNHPQLARFKEYKDPAAAINAYLTAIYKEAVIRGYCFNRVKIRRIVIADKIRVNAGQAEYELMHLKRKLKKRNYENYLKLRRVRKPDLNTVFRSRKGGVEPWEKIQA